MTNPDNVGGLRRERMFHDVMRDLKREFPADWEIADSYVRSLEEKVIELCRAAPAGGDEKVARFGHHPDPAIDFEIEVESLQSRLFNAKHGLAKVGTQPETVGAVSAAIARAMEFRVGGDESAVRAKAMLRALQSDSAPAGGDVERFSPDCEPCSDFESWVGCMRPDPNGQWVRYAPAGSVEVDSNTVRQALKSYMASFGTQRQFAKSHGVSESYVSDVLRGHRNIPEEWVSSLGFRTVWVGPAALLRKLQQGADGELDALRLVRDQWIEENGPGGWIDELRNAVDRANALADRWDHIYGRFADELRSALERPTRPASQGQEGSENGR